MDSVPLPLDAPVTVEVAQEEKAIADADKNVLTAAEPRGTTIGGGVSEGGDLEGSADAVKEHGEERPPRGQKVKRNWKEERREKRHRGGASGNKRWQAWTGDADQPEADGNVAVSATPESGPRQERSREEIRQARVARKEAYTACFRARCAAGTTVVLDLEWEEEMNEKELKSLIQQVLYCYGANRAASSPVNLVFSGLREGGLTQSKLAKQSGFDTWIVQASASAYIDLFPKERLVYLTADAEEVVWSFDPKSVYVIGGIVDRNRLKGRTLQKAQEQGIRTARLPLSEHISLLSSRVLTVNHVLSCIVEHQASGNWRSVLEKCIPGRKQFVEDAPSAGGEERIADGVLQKGTEDAVAQKADLDSGVSKDVEVAEDVD